MDIIIDSSALIAVMVNEPEREKIIYLTSGHTLICPGSILWEIGNAFSAMFKQDRISLNEAQKGITILENIPIRYTSIDLINSLTISKKANIYAYDAYLLDCAIRFNSPLLTLDKKLLKTANDLSIRILEV